MKFLKTELRGVYVIEPRVFQDDRGLFIKIFHEQTFKESGLSCDFKEVFYSTSMKDVIRGMHFQIPPQDHAKLVYVVSGKIFDVVLDIRKNSPTFGKCLSVELSDDNKKSIYIPSGFAHGFCVLSDEATVIYMQTTMHSPEHDSGIRWDSFGMEWGIKNPILSQRDKNFPELKKFDSPFTH